MIVTIIWLVAKTIFAVVFLAMIYLGYKMYCNIKLLSYYEGQGITALRGSHNLPLGLVSVTAKWRKLKDAMT